MMRRLNAYHQGDRLGATLRLCLDFGGAGRFEVPVEKHLALAIADQLEGATLGARRQILTDLLDRLCSPWRPSYGWRGDPRQLVRSLTDREMTTFTNNVLVALAAVEIDPDPPEAA